MRWCDLYSGLAVSLLTYHDELVEAYGKIGKINGVKLPYTGVVLKCMG